MGDSKQKGHLIKLNLTVIALLTLAVPVLEALVLSFNSIVGVNAEVVVTISPSMRPTLFFKKCNTSVTFQTTFDQLSS